MRSSSFAQLSVFQDMCSSSFAQRQREAVLASLLKQLQSFKKTIDCVWLQWPDDLQMCRYLRIGWPAQAQCPYRLVFPVLIFTGRPTPRFLTKLPAVQEYTFEDSTERADTQHQCCKVFQPRLPATTSCLHSASQVSINLLPLFSGYSWFLDIASSEGSRGVFEE